MNLYLLDTVVRDTKIENDASLVNDAVDFLVTLIGDFVKMLRTIYVYEDENRLVSLFDFIIVLSVMAIVITYLLNIAKRPAMETTTETRHRRAEARRREEDRNFNPSDYL